MVIDTSALVAVLFDEAEREEFVEAMAQAPRLLISAGTLIECSVAVEARSGESAGREVDLFLHRGGVEVIAIDEDQASIARTAWRTYGTGRHAAGLNLGDLFSYALATSMGEELLFKGDDFVRTDITRAQTGDN